MFIIFIILSATILLSNEELNKKLNHKILIECPGNIGCDCNDNNDCNNSNCIRIPKGGYCMPAYNDTLPDFYSLNQFEELVSLKEFKTDGKFILLEMGTTWCAPCNVLANWLTWDDNEIESKRLKKKLPKDPNLRLACQLTISSDLKIHTL